MCLCTCKYITEPSQLSADYVDLRTYSLPQGYYFIENVKWQNELIDYPQLFLYLHKSLHGIFKMVFIAVVCC